MGKLLNRLYLDLALRLRNEEEGQTLVEYALIGVLVALVVATALSGVATHLTTALDNVAKEIAP